MQCKIAKKIVIKNKSLITNSSYLEDRCQDQLLTENLLKMEVEKIKLEMIKSPKVYSVAISQIIKRMEDHYLTPELHSLEISHQVEEAFSVVP